MTHCTKLALLQTKREIVRQVDQGQLSVNTAASLLKITRQGLWKLRRNCRRHGLTALVGRKRGPQSGIAIHNRTPLWAEEKVETLYLKYGVGPTKLTWIIEDYYHDELGFLQLSRATVYRILVRRRCLFPRVKQPNLHCQRYSKGYPGEEVQLDTTEPFGKGKGVQLTIVDDHSRWGGAFMYWGNTSANAANRLQWYLMYAPFPIRAVRVDNGSEFKKDFAKFCQMRGISLKRNPVHTPEHNGKVERLHRTIEEECLWRLQPQDRLNLETINYELVKYIHWYNSKRRHQGYGLEGRTPQQQIERYIINQLPTAEYSREVNETLILYKKCVFVLRLL